MGLFGKKKEVRFETIIVDREREVFRALEDRGWALCSEPFQFDIQKPPEKIRKDAMKTAHDLDAELVVEVWDPLFSRTPWKGLKYAAWRRATPEEMRLRMAKMSARPNYKDTMGSYEEIERKLDQKLVRVSTEEMKALDTVVQTQDIKLEGEVYGSAEEDMGMKSADIEAVKAFNPYENQGSLVDDQAAATGPLFESEMELKTGEPDSYDPTGKIDPLAMMEQAAQTQPQTQPPAPQAPQPAPMQPTPAPISAPPRPAPPPAQTSPPQRVVHPPVQQPAPAQAKPVQYPAPFPPPQYQGTPPQQPSPVQQQSPPQAPAMQYYPPHPPQQPQKPQQKPQGQ